MRLFHGYENAEIARPTVLTLGVFDGLHLGHQLIVSRVVERARAIGAVPTVITFDPHPRAVLHPESAPPLLQTFDQKIEAFDVLGVEQTIVVRFTREFAEVRAEEFLRDVVHERLQAREVYLGRGFAFGRGREGDIELLRQRERRAGLSRRRGAGGAPARPAHQLQPHPRASGRGPRQPRAADAGPPLRRRGARRARRGARAHHRLPDGEPAPATIASSRASAST